METGMKRKSLQNKMIKEFLFLVNMQKYSANIVSFENIKYIIWDIYPVIFWSGLSTLND